jgi:opacity protein-like surface antigen
VNDLSRQGERSTLAQASLGILLIAASPTFSNEITLGVDSAFIRESNFYRTPSNETAADSVEVSGTITAEREEGRLHYLASYTGSYQDYSDQEGASAPEHRLRLRSSFDIDSTTTFHFNNRYRDVQNLRFSPEDILDGDSGLEPNNDRYRRNDLELMLHKYLTRTWEMELNATHRFINFSDNTNRSDSDSFEIGSRVYHRFARRHRFGGGVSYVRQDIDGADTRLDAEAQYLLTNVAWSFDIADQVQLMVYGGPVFISTDENNPGEILQEQFVGFARGDDVFRANVNSCGFDEELGSGIASRCDVETPGAPPILADDLGEFISYPLEAGPSVGEDDDVVLFGGASLSATFSDWTVDAEIQRQPSSTSGDAVAASVTRFRWEVGYEMGQSNWDAYIAGSWEKREGITNSTRIDFTVIPGPENAAQRDVAFTRIRDSDDRRIAFTGLVGLRKQFSRGLSASVSYRYRRTEQRVSGNETFRDFSFLVIQASYVFDSFRL